MCCLEEAQDNYATGKGSSLNCWLAWRLGDILQIYWASTCAGVGLGNRVVWVISDPVNIPYPYFCNNPNQILWLIWTLLMSIFCSAVIPHLKWVDFCFCSSGRISDNHKISKEDSRYSRNKDIYGLESANSQNYCMLESPLTD